MLLPGLDGTGLLFQSLVAALPATIRPIVVRYPGDKRLSYDELLPIVMDALPRGERFILLGESFSGPLAVNVVSQRPAGLVGLILCATFVTRPWRMIGPVVPLVARALPFQFYLPYKRVKARLGGYLDSEHRAMLVELGRLVRPSVVAARVRMVFKVDARAQLASCEVPILYMQGAKDWVVPGDNLRLIRQLKPDIQVVTLDSSHMILQHHATQAAQIIADFASSL